MVMVVAPKDSVVVMGLGVLMIWARGPSSGSRGPPSITLGCEGLGLGYRGSARTLVLGSRAEAPARDFGERVAMLGDASLEQLEAHAQREEVDRAHGTARGLVV